MQSALKLRTTILPGHRIEVTAPELPESGEVELIIVLPEPAAPTPEEPRQFKSVMDFLNSLTPVQRTPEEWAEVERQIQEEKNSWDF